jgi:hypothetical protein
MSGTVIEYYDRGTRCHMVGTFFSSEEPPITKGDKFIVPTSERYIGCLEGRAGDAYMKPILLVCRGVSDTHIISEGYGAFRKDLCFYELS